MEEKERDKLMEEKEFEEYLQTTLNLRTFEAVGRFKSVGRAFRRGHITSYGIIIPKRPFNNRANTSKRPGVHSRVFNERKKQVYVEYIQNRFRGV